MNVETVERSCWDASRTFSDEFGSIEVVIRTNRDLPNDRGEGMIGDMPLLHIK